MMYDDIYIYMMFLLIIYNLIEFDSLAVVMMT